jgi:hypothetical protein
VVNRGRAPGPVSKARREHAGAATTEAMNSVRPTRDRKDRSRVSKKGAVWGLVSNIRSLLSWTSSGSAAIEPDRT